MLKARRVEFKLPSFLVVAEGMTEEEAKKILVTQENLLPSYEMSFFEKFWEMQVVLYNLNII